ncbi:MULTISPECIES: NADH-quinone oxidoreductase subunit C [unclassified Luteimonas]
MSESATAFATRLHARFPQGFVEVALPRGEVGLVLGAAEWREGCRVLRDEFGFEVLIDLCGVDHLGYGTDEWDTNASSEGFSRGVEGKGPGRFRYGETPSQQLDDPDGVGAIPLPENRFSVVVQLLSIANNRRLRVTCHAPDDALPIVDSLCDVWEGVNWFERETFDLFGIVFPGHPDLRRLLTDYGFIGHPFRKDFPLIGNVEVRYDAEKQRVIYEPVTSVEPRVLVPRVIRDDAHLATARGEARDLKVGPVRGVAPAGDAK